MAKLDPIVSEFATTEDAEAHDKWFREQVEAALAESDDDNVPHEQVMAHLQGIIDKHRDARSDLAA